MYCDQVAEKDTLFNEAVFSRAVNLLSIASYRVQKNYQK